MTDQSNYYFWQYASDGTNDDDFGRPRAFAWDEDSDDWSFAPEDYAKATDYVLNTLSRLVALRRNSGSTGSVAIPHSNDLHNMICDVADAFATERRRNADA